jgi:hypothetical protein
MKVEESVVPNRFALALVFHNSFNPDSVCTINFNSNGEYKLTGANGELITVTESLQFKPPRCRYEDVLAFKDLAQKIFEFGNNIQSMEQVSQIQMLISTLTAREAYIGCRQLVDSWLTFKDVDAVVEGTTKCHYKYDEDEWASDPCCNYSLRDSQCCVPHDYTISVKKIDTIQTEFINQMCTNPKKVSALLGNIIDASKFEVMEDYNPYSVFSELSGPLNKCYQAVFDSTCESDVDCPYSDKCDQKGRCFVDWMNPGPALLKCFIANMSSAMRLEFQKILQIPTSYDDIDEEVATTVESVIKFATIEDCTGPASWEFKKRTEWQPDEKGNYKPVVIPGNQEGCLAAKSCKYSLFFT